MPQNHEESLVWDRKFWFFLFSQASAFTIPASLGPLWKQFLGSVKKRDPNPALLGGVNAFPNKKGLVRCMTMIENALNRYDLGKHFTYSWRDEKIRRKFFRAIWSQKLRQKMRIFKIFGASFWTSSQWIFSFFFICHCVMPSDCF